MNRRITYASQLANSLFALQDQNEYMFDFSTLIYAILGNTTQLSGLECTPTISPSLIVDVGPGSIFEQEVVDATAFGTAPSVIAPDSRLIMKFAYQPNITPFTFVAPTTPGDSRNDLIEISFQEIDGTSTGLAFFGGIDEVTVLTPEGTTDIPVANDSISNTVNVERLNNVVFTVKTGTPAPTGTQVTPTPDAGTIGAWVITTTQGVSTIGTGDIARYPGAPFLIEKLKDKAGISSIQNNSYTSGTTTGSANAYLLALTPAITAYQNNQVFTYTPNFTNTGAATLNINSVGTLSQVKYSGGALVALAVGDIVNTNAVTGIVSGSNFILLNPSISGSVLQTANYNTGTPATGTALMPISTAPQITDGTQFFSLVFTPLSASSTLLITVSAQLANGAGDGNHLVGCLFENGITAALATADFKSSYGGTAFFGNMLIRYSMTSGTTSPITFSFRAGGNVTSTTYFNQDESGNDFGDTFSSGISIIEIAS